jgi:2-polyprenyl-3-methyl-5-hydroxy-6-metoxy-1,4-benzoquinol methylase
MSPTLTYQDITWWHSIDLGDGTVTPGRKSAQLLQEEFDQLHLTSDGFGGKRVLDIGCNDRFMCLMYERLGAQVVGIDGIHGTASNTSRLILSQN